jgi:sporulation protein YlmC with PRC-barrel domain
MDRQILEPDGRMAGKVDDLELTAREDGTLVVTAILTGPGAHGRRLPGLLGRIVLATWRRLYGDFDPQPGRIDFDHVVDIGSAVRVSLPREGLPNQRLEHWARRQIIGKLPGAGHAPE